MSRGKARKTRFTKTDFLPILFSRRSAAESLRHIPGVTVQMDGRDLGSMYSDRMVRAFGSRGMVRLSPLHVNTPEEIRRFLEITQEMAAT